MTNLNATAAAEALKTAAAEFAALQTANVTNGTKWYGTFKRNRAALIKAGMDQNNAHTLMNALQRQHGRI